MRATKVFADAGAHATERSAGHPSLSMGVKILLSIGLSRTDVMATDLSVIRSASSPPGS
jgi:hypothetical protein